MKPECSANKEKYSASYLFFVYLLLNKKNPKWTSSKCGNSIIFTRSGILSKISEETQRSLDLYFCYPSYARYVHIAQGFDGQH